MIFGIILFLSFSAFGACKLDETKYRNDLFSNMRDMFEVPGNRRIVFEKRLPPEEVAIALDQLSEDRIFDKPRTHPKSPCPDRIIRLYFFIDQDGFRKCNGVLRSDMISGVHDILYRNCISL